MKDFIITCCSTVDLSNEFIAENNAEYISFSYNLDGVDYLDDMGKTISANDFFNKIKNGADARTSQVNSEQYIKFWERFIKEGKDVLHVTLSSGISGSYNSAMLAKKYLEEKYSDTRIEVIDSLGASSGYGLLMSYLFDMKKEGASLDECCNWAENNKLNVHHWFLSTDLTSYKKGGRISSTSFFLGQLLKICPLLNMDNLGRLIPRKKIRTKEKTINEMMNKMIEHVQNGYSYDGKCYICHSAIYEDAVKLKNMIEEKFVNLKNKVKIYDIGTVIGSHTGPGTLALFFLGDKRVD